GQVVVDFGVGQVALFQALADQLLDIGLLGRTFVGHVVLAPPAGGKEENLLLYQRCGTPAVRWFHGRHGRRAAVQAPALSRKVTRPSLTRLTLILAPKPPVSTSAACFSRQIATNRLNIRSASAGAAALVKPGRMPERVSAASVNWLTSSRPPPVSRRERFILPASSAKTR